ncbi:MAG: dephospho-CoA kinase [Thiotrichales bacterium]|nr:dephospho-CoA kinase [Thiotrichales bacterium]
MKIIGLTGGIGSGKSTFCALMAERGIETVDTDQIAREVVAPGTMGLQQVLAEFGQAMQNSDGSLNRAALREDIFTNPADEVPRKKLEGILHPLIQAETQRQIWAYQQDATYQAPYLLVAIPLLVEGILKTGQKPSYLDEIWVLDCDEATQIARARQRDGVTQQQIEAIIASQATRAQRRTWADWVIHNDADLTNLKQQINARLTNP